MMIASNMREQLVVEENNDFIDVNTIDDIFRDECEDPVGELSPVFRMSKEEAEGEMLADLEWNLATHSMMYAMGL